MSWKITEFNDRPEVKPSGLGTRLKAVIRPVAVLSDKVLKTELVNCEGCAKREEKLNELGERIKKKVRKIRG
jgi:hypothetical protein